VGLQIAHSAQRGSNRGVVSSGRVMRKNKRREEAAHSGGNLSDQCGGTTPRWALMGFALDALGLEVVLADGAVF